MEDSVQPVSPPDGQARDPFLIDDRIRDGTQRGRLSEGLMGAVPVVELFVLAQSRQRSSSSRRQDCTHRSMIAFILGIRIPVSTV
ncbi:hypothetical protein [Herbidospora yilanensis]|uniref:hypothetical protein n=1 Tax=Herbidospora yilanensis TaxID=354426 RepID=UPI000783C95B|nr:hypothetical protein [Herbidospora yilanensis]